MASVIENVRCQHSSGTRTLTHLRNQARGRTMRTPTLVALVRKNLVAHEALDVRGYR
jgi:hypothetical protein